MIGRWPGLLIALWVLTLPVAVLHAGAEPVYKVIVHPSNDITEIDRRELSRMFLKKDTRWPNNDIIRPVDLPIDSEVRQAFTEEVIGRTVSAVRSHWQQMIFAGRGVPPLELRTDADVVRYVLSTKDAVGYVSQDTPVGEAKVVELR